MISRFFKLLFFVAMLCSSICHAQLNPFAEESARTAQERQLLIKAHITQKNTYVMRIRLGKATGDSVLLSSLYFDGKGNLVKSIFNQHGDIKATITTDHIITDKYGNILQQTLSKGAGSVPFTVAYKYNPGGQPVNYNGEIYLYDARGNRVEEHNGIKSLTRYEYDDKNRLLKKWLLTSKHPTPLLIEEYQYQEADHQTIQYKTTRSIDNDTLINHYQATYNLRGNKVIEYRIDKAGQKTPYYSAIYSISGNLVETLSPSYSSYYHLQRTKISEHTVYTYNADGLLSTTTQYQKDNLTGTETLSGIEKNYYFK